MIDWYLIYFFEDLFILYCFNYNCNLVVRIKFKNVKLLIIYFGFKKYYI